MPRVRRQPDLSDVIAYVHGRKKKLKGPRRLIYQYVLDMCLEQSAALHPEKVCEECSANLRHRPSKAAMDFAKAQLN